MSTYYYRTTGNFNSKGWKIGTVPDSVQIMNALNDIREIEYIRTIKISGFMREEKGLVEIDLDREDITKFALPVNGVHEIVVEVK